MENILKKLPRCAKDENLLVGYDTNDDACIYKINDDISIVNTLDFFPAMIEDPYIFGQVAATNALSDIYAMGGQPITAMNIVCFPDNLNINILENILKGGAEKIREANCQLAGGHSIVDDTIKYGLSVTGVVKTNKIIKNNTVRLNDKLILTKPLGIGIRTTAYKCNDIKDDDYENMVKTMTTLNKYAMDIAINYNISAMTDVTGFGLLIHLKEMLTDKYSANIYFDNIPLISKNLEYYIKNEYFTGASKRNENAIKNYINFIDLYDWQKYILYDPQTSGGLLISVSDDEANQLLNDLNIHNINAKVIGEVIWRQDSVINLKK